MTEMELDVDQKPEIHIPVMLSEIIEYLNLKSGGTYVDGTLGMAGHSQAILNQIGAKGRLVGIDCDAQSLAMAKERLKPFANQCYLVNSNFSKIDTVLEDLKIAKVDGILLDLGISSFQIENPERGFSFRQEEPLDMRLDQNISMSAYDLVNSLSEKEISKILRDYGQERWHNRIAKYIITQRAKNAIETTDDLSRIVLKAIGQGQKWQKIHPATRTFQAFRIAVNRELDVLKEALEKCVEVLDVGGRVAVISFHSLEDAIVKHYFRLCAKEEKIKIITTKPLRPTDEESERNPRSRSARLRVAERI